METAETAAEQWAVEYVVELRLEKWVAGCVRQVRIRVGCLDRRVAAFVLRSSWTKKYQLECGPMPNVVAALPNVGGALCSTPQSLADAHY